MIKAVMFDAGGVLHFSHKTQAVELKEELGLSDEHIKELFSHYIPLLGTGKLSEKELWTELKEKYGIRQVDTSEELFTKNFRKILKKIPGMYELVDELKAKGLEVALLTNVSPQYAKVLREKGHYDPFNIKVLSYEVGSWKPDLGIYYNALERLNLKPEDTIFIDDAEINIKAAESIGIHGIVFKNTEQLKSKLNTLLN